MAANAVRSAGRALVKALAIMPIFAAPAVATAENAVVLSQSVPTTMVAGERYTVSVTVQNLGPETWQGEQISSPYRLGVENPSYGVWGLQRVTLPGPVSTNQTVTFYFTVTAPQMPGTFGFQWRMVHETVVWFGAPSPLVQVAVRTPLAKDARFLAQSVPTSMVAGQQYSVSLTVKNVGTETWTTESTPPPGHPYRLGVENPPYGLWGPSRVFLPGPVSAGRAVTLSVTVTAPSTPGSYTFRWRMVHETVAWFGDASPSLQIVVRSPVSKDATVLSHSVPTSMVAGRPYTVSVTVKNVGTVQWTPESTYPPFRLGVETPPYNLWGPSRVTLAETVASGQTVIFSFTVTAPSTPGTYTFQWRMVHETVAWFGDASPAVAVAVRPSWTTAAAQGLLWQSPDGRDITVPQGREVVLDTDLNMGFLTVEGKLYCDPSRDLNIISEGIMIHSGIDGLFECGTPEVPYTKKLTIDLVGNRSMGQNMGTQALVVMDGGVLSLHGRTYAHTWLKIDEHAPIGSTYLHLEKTVDWPNGSEIVLASTRINPFEAEVATITSVTEGGKKLNLSAGLQHSHWGTTESFSNGERTWILDERAEVGLLSRNIAIRGSNTNDPLTGGHLMVHGGKAYLQGVELYHMGQLGQMGRYPVHWHLKGDSQGEYILDSSIHRSFQRCVTVHGTHRLRVQDNVCFDHYGHGYFIEDGNETGNRFIHNLGLVSRRPEVGRELLFSDNRTVRPLAFDPPATFWIANPANEFVDNSAAGSMGAGYWFSLKTPAVPVPGYPLAPSQTDLLRFERNTAHSSLTGVTLDGGPVGPVINNPRNPGGDRELAESHYGPATMPVFRGLTIFKTAGTGFWARGEKMEVVDSVFGDNLRAITFSFQQKLKDSVIVAKSANFDAVFPSDASELVPPPLQDNFAPRGALEIVGSQISGWACDPDDYGQAIDVTLFHTLPFFPAYIIGQVTASQTREQAVGNACGSNPNHGFTFTVPNTIPPLPLSIHAIAHNNLKPAGAAPGGYPGLTGSARTLWQLSPPSGTAPVIPSPFSAGWSAPLYWPFSSPQEYFIPRRIWGVGLYDGPWVLENVHFANFDEQPQMLADGSEIIVSPFPLFGGDRQATSNMATGITFDPPAPYRKAFLKPNTSVDDNLHGGDWTLGIIDVDGSITGHSGYSLVPDHPVNLVPGCEAMPNWKAYACPARYASIHMNRLDYNVPGKPTMTYKLQRVGGQVHDFTHHAQNKFGFVMNESLPAEGYNYELTPSFDLIQPTELEFQYVMPGEKTPIIRIWDPNNMLRLRRIIPDPDVTPVTSLAQLAAANQTTFANVNGYFYFKMVANRTNMYWEPYNGRGTVWLCRQGTCPP